METAELYRFQPIKSGEVVTIEEKTLLQHIRRAVRAYRQAGLDPHTSNSSSYPGFSTDECDFQIHLGRSRKGSIRGSHFSLTSPNSNRTHVDYVNEGDIFIFKGILDISVGRILRPHGRDTWIATDYALNTERLGMINELIDDHLALDHFRAFEPESRLLLPLKECYE